MPTFGASGLRPVRVSETFTAVPRGLGWLALIKKELANDAGGGARVEGVEDLTIKSVSITFAFPTLGWSRARISIDNTLIFPGDGAWDVLGLYVVMMTAVTAFFSNFHCSFFD